MLNLDKLVMYPPEVLFEGVVQSLPANAPIDVFNYQPTILRGKTVFFMQPAFNSQAISATLTYDTETLKFTLDNIKGLDYEEDIRVPASNVLRFTLLSPSTLTYAFRYKLAVYKSTPLIKLLTNQTLSEDEKAILQKYDVPSSIQVEIPTMRNPLEGIEKLYIKNGASGTIVDAYPKPNEKLVLLSISVQRPASTGSYVYIERDDVAFDPMDATTFPALSYNYFVRIVALKHLKVTSDVPCKVTYGSARITIPEKIRWGIKLTSEEESIADKYDLKNRVLAGII